MSDEMMMTVLKGEDKDYEIATINIFDVDYIETVGKRVIFYINDEKFYQIQSKIELEEILRGKGFDSLDRPNLVNIRKIKYFDEEYGKVYFVENPTSKDKFATVAKIKIKFVKKFIQKAISMNNGTTMEISPEKSRSLLSSIFKLGKEEN